MVRGEKTAEEVLAEPKEDGSILGTRYQRPSALAKVTGMWDFGADVALRMPANTLRLALVQAKVSHAHIKGIDTSEAETMPGVAKVITWKDVKGKNAITGLITFPTNKGDGWDRPILCKDKVFQFGDAIAIVAADTVEHARAAVEEGQGRPRSSSGLYVRLRGAGPDAMEIHPACRTSITSREWRRARTPSRSWKRPRRRWTSRPTAAGSRICTWSRTAASPTSRTTAC